MNWYDAQDKSVTKLDVSYPVFERALAWAIADFITAIEERDSLYLAFKHPGLYDWSGCEPSTL